MGSQTGKEVKLSGVAKRLLSLTLSVLMVFTAIPFTAAAAPLTSGETLSVASDPGEGRQEFNEQREQPETTPTSLTIEVPPEVQNKDALKAQAKTNNTYAAVGTWSEFLAAYNNANITYIELTANIASTKTSGSGATSTSNNTGVSGVTRARTASLIIDGSSSQYQMSMGTASSLNLAEPAATTLNPHNADGTLNREILDANPTIFPSLTVTNVKVKGVAGGYSTNNDSGSGDSWIQYAGGYNRGGQWRINLDNITMTEPGVATGNGNHYSHAVSAQGSLITMSGSNRFISAREGFLPGSIAITNGSSFHYTRSGTNDYSAFYFNVNQDTSHDIPDTGYNRYFRVGDGADILFDFTSTTAQSTWSCVHGPWAELRTGDKVNWRQVQYQMLVNPDDRGTDWDTFSDHPEGNGTKLGTRNRAAIFGRENHIEVAKGTAPIVDGDKYGTRSTRVSVYTEFNANSTYKFETLNNPAFRLRAGNTYGQRVIFNSPGTIWMGVNNDSGAPVAVRLFDIAGANNYVTMNNSQMSIWRGTNSSANAADGTATFGKLNITASSADSNNAVVAGWFSSGTVVRELETIKTPPGKVKINYILPDGTVHHTYEKDYSTDENAYIGQSIDLRKGAYTSVYNSATGLGIPDNYFFALGGTQVPANANQNGGDASTQDNGDQWGQANYAILPVQGYTNEYNIYLYGEEEEVTYQYVNAFTGETVASKTDLKDPVSANFGHEIDWKNSYYTATNLPIGYKYLTDNDMLAFGFTGILNQADKLTVGATNPITKIYVYRDEDVSKGVVLTLKSGPVAELQLGDAAPTEAVMRTHIDTAKVDGRVVNGSGVFFKDLTNISIDAGFDANKPGRYPVTYTLEGTTVKGYIVVGLEPPYGDYYIYANNFGVKQTDVQPGSQSQVVSLSNMQAWHKDTLEEVAVSELYVRNGIDAYTGTPGAFDMELDVKGNTASQGKVITAVVGDVIGNYVINAEPFTLTLSEAQDSSNNALLIQKAKATAYQITPFKVENVAVNPGALRSVQSAAGNPIYDITFSVDNPLAAGAEKVVKATVTAGTPPMLEVDTSVIEIPITDTEFLSKEELQNKITTAWDEQDVGGNMADNPLALKGKVDITNNVQLGKKGIYKVTYTLTDNDQNAVSRQVVVNVGGVNPPIDGYYIEAKDFLIPSAQVATNATARNTQILERSATPGNSAARAWVAEGDRAGDEVAVTVKDAAGYNVLAEGAKEGQNFRPVLDIDKGGAIGAPLTGTTYTISAFVHPFGQDEDLIISAKDFSLTVADAKAADNDALLIQKAGVLVERISFADNGDVVQTPVTDVTKIVTDKGGMAAASKPGDGPYTVTFGVQGKDKLITTSEASITGASTDTPPELELDKTAFAINKGDTITLEQMKARIVTAWDNEDSGINAGVSKTENPKHLASKVVITPNTNTTYNTEGVFTIQYELTDESGNKVSDHIAVDVGPIKTIGNYKYLVNDYNIQSNLVPPTIEDGNGAKRKAQIIEKSALQVWYKDGPKADQVAPAEVTDLSGYAQITDGSVLKVHSPELTFGGAEDTKASVNIEVKVLDGVVEEGYVINAKAFSVNVAEAQRNDNNLLIERAGAKAANINDPTEVVTVRVISKSNLETVNEAGGPYDVVFGIVGRDAPRVTAKATVTESGMPILEVNESVEIPIGGTYSARDQIITVQDAEGNDLDKNLVVIGGDTVNPNVNKTYQVTYTLTHGGRTITKYSAVTVGPSTDIGDYTVVKQNFGIHSDDVASTDTDRKAQVKELSKISAAYRVGNKAGQPAGKPVEVVVADLDGYAPLTGNTKEHVAKPIFSINNDVTTTIEATVHKYVQFGDYIIYADDFTIILEDAQKNDNTMVIEKAKAHGKVISTSAIVNAEVVTKNGMENATDQSEYKVTFKLTGQDLPRITVNGSVTLEGSLKAEQEKCKTELREHADKKIENINKMSNLTPDEKIEEIKKINDLYTEWAAEIDKATTLAGCREELEKGKFAMDQSEAKTQLLDYSKKTGGAIEDLANLNPQERIDAAAELAQILATYQDNVDASQNPAGVLGSVTAGEAKMDELLEKYKGLDKKNLEAAQKAAIDELRIYANGKNTIINTELNSLSAVPEKQAFVTLIEGEYTTGSGNITNAKTITDVTAALSTSKGKMNDIETSARLQNEKNLYKKQTEDKAAEFVNKINDRNNPDMDGVSEADKNQAIIDINKVRDQAKTDIDKVSVIGNVKSIYTVAEGDMQIIYDKLIGKTIEDARKDAIAAVNKRAEEATAAVNNLDNLTAAEKAPYIADIEKERAAGVAAINLAQTPTAVTQEKVKAINAIDEDEAAAILHDQKNAAKNGLKDHAEDIHDQMAAIPGVNNYPALLEEYQGKVADALQEYSQKIDNAKDKGAIDSEQTKGEGVMDALLSELKSKIKAGDLQTEKDNAIDSLNRYAAAAVGTIEGLQQKGHLNDTQATLYKTNINRERDSGNSAITAAETVEAVRAALAAGMLAIDKDEGNGELRAYQTYTDNRITALENISDVKKAQGKVDVNAARDTADTLVESSANKTAVNTEVKNGKDEMDKVFNALKAEDTKNLEDSKTDLINELKGYAEEAKKAVNALENLTTEEKAPYLKDIDDALKDGIDAINAANTVAAAEAAQAEAMGKMDDAVDAAELADAKKAGIKDLQDHADLTQVALDALADLKPIDRQNAAKELEAILTEYEGKVNAATDPTSVTNNVAEGKQKMDDLLERYADKNEANLDEIKLDKSNDLKAYAAARIAEINGFTSLSTFEKNTYTTQINTELERGLGNIDKAKTGQEVDNALIASKRVMDDVVASARLHNAQNAGKAELDAKAAELVAKINNSSNPDMDGVKQEDKNKAITDIQSIRDVAKTKVEQTTGIDNIAPIVNQGKTDMQDIYDKLVGKTLEDIQSEKIAELTKYAEDAKKKVEALPNLSDAEKKVYLDAIDAARDAGIAAIKAAKTPTAVNEGFNNAVNKIDKSVADATLHSDKNGGKKDLGDYADKIKEEMADVLGVSPDVIKEYQDKIDDILAKYEKEIDSSLSKDAVNNQVREGKGEMDAALRELISIATGNLSDAKMIAKANLEKYAKDTKTLIEGMLSLTDDQKALYKSQVEKELGLGNAAIEAAETIEAVQVALNAGKVAMDKDWGNARLRNTQNGINADIDKLQDVSGTKKADAKSEIEGIRVTADQAVEGKADRPTVVVAVEDGEAKMKAVFDRLKAENDSNLKAAQDKAIQELKDYAEEKKANIAALAPNLTPAEILAYQTVVDVERDKGIKAIEAAQNQVEVGSALTNAKQEIDKVESAAMLQAEKNAAIKELEAKAKELTDKIDDPNNPEVEKLTEKQKDDAKAEIAAILEQAKKDVTDAQSKLAIDNIKSKGKADMQDVYDNLVGKNFAQRQAEAKADLDAYAEAAKAAVRALPGLNTEALQKPFIDAIEAERVAGNKAIDAAKTSTEIALVLQNAKAEINRDVADAELQSAKNVSVKALQDHATLVNGQIDNVVGASTEAKNNAKAEVAEILTEYTNKVNTSNSIDLVKTNETLGKAAMDAVKTKLQSDVDQTLATKQAEAKADLEKYAKAARDKVDAMQNLSDAQKTEFKNLINEQRDAGYTAIDSAKTIEAVETALTGAKLAIDKEQGKADLKDCQVEVDKLIDLLADVPASAKTKGKADVNTAKNTADGNVAAAESQTEVNTDVADGKKAMRDIYDELKKLNDKNLDDGKKAAIEELNDYATQAKEEVEKLREPDGHLTDAEADQFIKDIDDALSEGLAKIEDAKSNAEVSDAKNEAIGKMDDTVEDAKLQDAKNKAIEELEAKAKELSDKLKDAENLEMDGVSDAKKQKALDEIAEILEKAINDVNNAQTPKATGDISAKGQSDMQKVYDNLAAERNDILDDRKEKAKQELRDHARDAIAVVESQPNLSLEEKAAYVAEIEAERDKGLEDIDYAATVAGVSDALLAAKLEINDTKAEALLQNVKNKGKQDLEDYAEKINEKIDAVPNVSQEDKDTALAEIAELLETYKAAVQEDISEAGVKDTVLQGKGAMDQVLNKLNGDGKKNLDDQKTLQKDSLAKHAEEAIRIINGLNYLTDLEKNAYITEVNDLLDEWTDAIDAAKTVEAVDAAYKSGKSAITAVVKKAQLQDARNKGVADLKRYADETNVKIGELKNVSDAKKQNAIGEISKILASINPTIRRAENQTEINNAVQDGKDAIDGIFNALRAEDIGNLTTDKDKAKEELKKAADDAKEAINNKPNLTPEEKQEFIDQVDDAYKEGVKAIEAATDKNEVDAAKEEAINEIKDVVKDATLRDQKNAAIKELEKYKDDLEQKIKDLENVDDPAKNEAIEKLEKALEDAIAAVEDAVNEKGVVDAERNGKAEMDKIFNDITGKNLENIKKDSADDLKKAADDAIKEIEDMQEPKGHLTEDEVKKFVDDVKKELADGLEAIENAKTPDAVVDAETEAKKEISEVVDNAELQNEKNKYLDAVREHAQNTKDRIDALPTISDADKVKAKQDVDKILREAEQNINAATEVPQVKPIAENAMRDMDDVYDALEAKQKDKAKEELKDKADDAKKEIDALPELTPDEKKEYKEKVDEEYNKGIEAIDEAQGGEAIGKAKDDAIDKIDDVVEDATLANEKEAKIKELEEYAEKSKEIIGDLYVSPEDKAKARDKIDEILKDAIEKIKASETIEEVGKATQDGKDAMDKVVDDLKNLQLLDDVNHVQYISGYEDGTVQPGGNLTRAEAAAIFYNLMKDPNKATANYTSNFTDVKSGQWHYKAISYLATKGIIAGYHDKATNTYSYQPSKQITRAEFSSIISKILYLNYQGGAANPFKDLNNSHWAYPAIISCYEAGIISGYEDKASGTFTFGASRNITRAEAISMVNNALNRQIEKTDIPTQVLTLRSYTDLRTDHWAYAAIYEASITHEYERKTNGYEYWTNWDGKTA